MAGLQVDKVLSTILPDFDEDLLSYIVSVVGDMSLEERRSISILKETVSPFLLDSGFSTDEAAADDVCRQIAVAFGGSGYVGRSSAPTGGLAGKPSAAAAVSTSAADEVQLLNAPVKMIDVSGLKPVKQTYGGAIFADSASLSTSDSSTINTGTVSLTANSTLDASAIPNTQKQQRKLRRENEQLQRTLRQEALARAAAAEEMAIARMAAIRACRQTGGAGSKAASPGVNLDRFSLPHPSGSGDLLTDASVTLVPGRRYGLIGRNGAGKSTLMRAFANYKYDGLNHLRILLVDQHVEGDDASPLQWLLRADVERSSLMEEEARLMAYLHNDPDAAPSTSALSTLPADLKGVNLELALAEVYERMDAIGANTAEARARKILVGLGFDAGMQDRPTSSLSGGWAMRAALGAALFVKPNLLLLDEPTNHLGV